MSNLQLSKSMYLGGIVSGGLVSASLSIYFMKLAIDTQFFKNGFFGSYAPSKWTQTFLTGVALLSLAILVAIMLDIGRLKFQNVKETQIDEKPWKSKGRILILIVSSIFSISTMVVALTQKFEFSRKALNVLGILGTVFFLVLIIESIASLIRYKLANKAVYGGSEDSVLEVGSEDSSSQPKSESSKRKSREDCPQTESVPQQNTDTRRHIHPKDAEFFKEKYSRRI